jgi:hypothetical protein
MLVELCIGNCRRFYFRPKFGRQKKSIGNFTQLTLIMSSLTSRSATQALRAASRRAPRTLVNAATRPAQAASYSLFAKAAAARCSPESTILVGPPLEQ